MSARKAAAPPLVAVARLHSELRRYRELDQDAVACARHFAVPAGVDGVLFAERGRQHARVQAAMDALATALPEGQKGEGP